LQVDEENITDWLACEPGFEMVNNDDIVRKGGREEHDSESEGEGKSLAQGKKKPHSAPLNHPICLLDCLESEGCCLLSDKLILCRLHSNIRKKESLANKKRKPTINRLFEQIVVTVWLFFIKKFMSISCS
jgi:hypothetical protein